MGLSAELADAVLAGRTDAVSAGARARSLELIARTFSGTMARGDRTLVDALMPAGSPARSTSSPTTPDALSQAATTAASAHRVLDCDAAGTSPCACAIVAAATATAHRHDVSGRVLVGAVAWGSEAQLRLAACMSPDHEDQGWDVTGTCGPVGAAVAAGLVLGSTPEQVDQAIGIATSLSLGHGSLNGSTSALHAGKAASNGVLAAHLAHSGFSASPTAIEGPRGFFAVIAPSADASRLLADIGERWLLVEQAPVPAVDLRADIRAQIDGVMSEPSVAALVDTLRGSAR